MDTNEQVPASGAESAPGPAPAPAPEEATPAPAPAKESGDPEESAAAPAPEGRAALPTFESNGEFLRFLFTRIREKRKWWLLPLLALLALLMHFLNLPKESVLPALYFLF